MAIIFDGKAFAKEKEIQLQKKVLQLKKKNITPKLVSLVIGDIDGAMKYQEMKKKAGERVGVEVEIQEVGEEITMLELLRIIGKLNEDAGVHGVMIQLPLPGGFSGEDKEHLIHSIAKEKDVDGMREDSPFIAPVVKAVLDALDEGLKVVKQSDPRKIAIIGAKGFEGKKMVKALMQNKYWIVPLDKGDLEDKEEGNVTHTMQTKLSEIIVSCTGVACLIKGDMIKEGAIVIDVGAPKGDFDFETVSKKASFITPVPGGIGPVTIINLMENVVEASELISA